jgi:hypothetical protein
MLRFFPVTVWFLWVLFFDVVGLVNNSFIALGFSLFGLFGVFACLSSNRRV